MRRAAFPSHTIAYSGRVGYRSIFPISLVESIPDIPLKTLFWLGPDTSLYTTPIGDGLFEVSGRGPEPKEVGEAVSWGQPADKETMKRHFTVRGGSSLCLGEHADLTGWDTKEYHPVARAIVDAIPPETIKQFAFFGGPQLETVIKHGSVALLGDASHRTIFLDASSSFRSLLRSALWSIRLRGSLRARGRLDTRPSHLTCTFAQAPVVRGTPSVR